MAATLVWFGRNDSKLKLKLLYEGAPDNMQFWQYMYFPVTVIRLSKSNFQKKKCKFERLYLRKCLCDKSVFFGDKHR